LPADDPTKRRDEEFPHREVGLAAVGFALIFASALCGGAFTLPMKYLRRFQWENIWLWGSFFAMIVIPWVIAAFVLPQPVAVVFGAGERVLMIALLFGFGWGVGTMMFGIGVSMIGLSLGYAIIMGVNTAFGSLLPMAILSRADLHTKAGHVILLGILVCIVGVFVCGYAGMKKESGSDAVRLNAGNKSYSGSVVKGMLVCVLAGLLAAFMNFGFAFAQDIAQKAREHGASSQIAGLGTWLAVFAGSFPAVLLGCGFLQLKRGTYRNNLGEGSRGDLWLSVVLGALWFGAIFLYGLGAFRLGRIGTSVGWAINISAQLLVANLLGFATGEWRGAPKGSVGWIVSGLGVVIASMAILAYGNTMLGRG
jgi:L-rhamnose-H+ transport protein